MKYIAAIPLFTYLLIAYFIVLTGSDPASLNQPIAEFNLFSGAQFHLSTNGIFLMLGTVALFIEMIKATRTGGASVLDHILSTLVFVAFLVTFLTVKDAGSEAFFVLMLMSLVDVIAGFTITIASARRDIGLDHQIGTN
ncbi:MAG TPA: hypothetical protein EYH03_02505 [Chromatiales bacterium]|nr:hypothetical protein [Chromatiales bacterium]